MSAQLFSVRIANSQDASEIDRLENLCLQESKNFRGSSELLAVAPLVGMQLDLFLCDVHHAIFIIETPAEVCGFAHLEFSEATALVRRIYISPTARDLGAGATLIDELRAYARLHGCTRIDAYALPGDRLSKNLFERAGMKARLLIASSEL